MKLPFRHIYGEASFLLIQSSGIEIRILFPIIGFIGCNVQRSIREVARS
jgi:hypothetical protein